MDKIRENILKMTHYSHASHIGAALSCADILYVIYAKTADINLNNLTKQKRDRVILSKGHASVALYSVLAELGLMPKEKLDAYYVDGGELSGHLDKSNYPAIDCSTGSLGHGLPIAIGMALACPEQKIFVIIGDGELNEGSVWEAVLFAGKHCLPNLTIIVDKNNLQALGPTNQIADYSKLSSVFTDFGLQTYEIDGHNLTEIEKVLKEKSSKTKIVIANTVKGKGVSFMENKLQWHYKSPNDEELALGLKELQL